MPLHVHSWPPITTLQIHSKVVLEWNGAINTSPHPFKPSTNSYCLEEKLDFSSRYSSRDQQTKAHRPELAHRLFPHSPWHEMNFPFLSGWKNSKDFMTKRIIWNSNYRAEKQSLLKQNHTRLFTYCLWLLLICTMAEFNSYHEIIWPAKPKMLVSCPSQKNFADLILEKKVIWHLLLSLLISDAPPGLTAFQPQEPPACFSDKQSTLATPEPLNS